MAKTAAKEPVKVKKERPKSNEKELAKQIRRLERDIEKQEEKIARLDAAMDGTDYEELMRILSEKETEEGVLTQLMEQWEQLQEQMDSADFSG